MQLINEFIFKDNETAENFINEINRILKNKNYITYGDICHILFEDDIEYNHYDIYKKHGWTLLPVLYVEEVKHFDDIQYLVKLPEVKLIDNFIKELELKGELK